VTTVLGVDGGGRKTYAVVVDAFGTLLGAGQRGPSNWEMAGVDVARDAITEAADGALADAGIARGAIDASVFGLAAWIGRRTSIGCSERSARSGSVGRAGS
jgi:N-acetylglucosamine kinase-like BadF-type ATPase